MFEEGKSGYVTDVEASLPLVEQALYSPTERIAHLVIVDRPECAHRSISSF
jgi:hypothetical protein